MMRSLWAGVSGLQAHQIAMDVEGNNIANVNTTGFKYSRANFSDMLSQTSKIATAPQGELGGKNAMQIGLGTQVSSVTKIFKQGSVQTTDKNTDLAIQGDGFFVVSPDGGSTYKYTRNGDFNFDALGNFTDSNGYIIQGWVKDNDTGVIDSTTPIQNITIPPGLTTPANDSSYITLKANLNSGDTIINKSTIYSLDQYNTWYDKDGNNIKSSTEVHSENDTSDNDFNTDNELVERGVDMGVLFNASGEALNIRQDQGLWVSYKDAVTQAQTITTNNTTNSLNIELNGVTITGTLTPSVAAPTQEENNLAANEIVNLINEKTNETGVTASIQNGNQIILTNNNRTGTEASQKNIKLDVTDAPGGFNDTTVITAYQYTYSSNPITTNFGYDDQTVRKFQSTEDLRAAIQTDARSWVNYNGNLVDDDGMDDATGGGDDQPWSTVSGNNKNDGVIVIVNEEGKFVIQNPNGDAFNENDDLRTGNVVQADINAALVDQNILFPAGTNFTNATTTLPADVTVTVTAPVAGTFTYGPTGADGAQIPALSVLSTEVTLPAGTVFGGDIDVGTTGIIDKYADTNFDDQDMFISVTGLTNSTNGISENEKLTTSFSALQGALTSGTSERTTQNIYMANHASSIDVYDSLGSKHTVRLEFTKVGTSDSGGAEWSIIISVPEPGEINYSGKGPENIVTGSISFNSDGSLATSNPTNLTYTANNGSSPNQNIELQFGTLGQFDGMTSFDQQSNTSGISQDGYPGGDLAGVRVDETGTLIGSFTNGRSFGLAQVSMASFTNNGGLESDGGNTFIQTSNSGDPVIGQASVGGRGFIQASALEMSNVDLSRSLTQLIVVQRGFQANSKTITTSDEMLQTLLQLK